MYPEINVLYEIVKRAESSSDRSIRAIFAAYHRVLEELGIHPNGDRIYFRFLLRMRDGAAPNETLSQQFENFLRRLGIEVVFDEDQRPEPDSGIAETAEEVTRTREHESDVLTPSFSRRASFTSLQDTIANQSHPKRETQQALPPRSHSQNSLLNRRKKYAMPTRGPSYGVQWSPPRGRMTNSNHRKLHPASSGKRLSFSGTAYDDSQESGYLDESEESRSDLEHEHEEGHQQQPRKTDVPAEVASNLLELEAKAKAYRFRRFALFACKLFRLWREKGQEIHNARDQMRRRAHTQDVTTLKRQVLDHWQESCHERRRAKDIEKFYQGLEDRAEKARDLFLLTKAFTHWAQCASEEVLRTSAARRHILRTKYFNAWRDVSAINELKVRRHGLRKFMDIWRSKTTEILRLDCDATLFHDSRVLESNYRQWFWHFCDQRAPSWYEARLKQHVFQKWLQLGRSATIRNFWSTDFAALRLLRKLFGFWTSRSSAMMQQDGIASYIGRRKLLAFTCEALRRELALVPPRVRLNQMIDIRIARSTLFLLKFRTMLDVEARKVDELRVMRNAWTTWNNRLRCLDLSRRIGDRLVMQASYKWVLAERCVQYYRLCGKKLVVSMFRQWNIQTEKNSSLRRRATGVAHLSREERVRKWVLQKWSSTLHNLDRQEAQAQSFRDHKLTKTAFAVWYFHTQRFLRLKQWAKYGEFYILAKKWFRRWQEVFLVNRKRRRHEAYASVRRMRKVSLVQNCFHRLCHQLRTNSAQRKQADEVCEHQIIRIASMIFFGWHEKAQQVLEEAEQALKIRRQRLLNVCAGAFVQRHQQLMELDLQATIHYDEARVIRAGNLLDKINWRIWQIKLHNKDARSFLEEKVRLPGRRKMLRYWYGRMAKRRASQEENEAATEGANVNNDRFQSLTVPQTPGYLKTPSRRITARSKSKLPAPGTPATTQITPFVWRLKSQYSGTGSQAGHSDFVKRLREPTRAIEEVPETDSHLGFGE